MSVGDTMVLRERAAQALVNQRKAKFVDDGRGLVLGHKPTEHKVVAPEESKKEPSDGEDRCRGLTKSGKRCKIHGERVEDGFCDMHENQRG